MLSYLHTFFNKNIIDESIKELIHQDMISKIEEYIDMSLIIEYEGFIYGECIRDMLIDYKPKIMDVSMPTLNLYFYINDIIKLGYKYNYDLSVLNQTNVYTKNDNSLRIVEEYCEFLPDVDIDNLIFDGYIITKRDTYSGTIYDIYDNISKREAKLLMKYQFDYTLKDKGFKILN